MKNLVVLFAGSITPRALDPLSGGPSSFERAARWAARVPDASHLVIAARADEASRIRELASGLALSIETEVVSDAAWTVCGFFSRIAALSEGYDHVFLSMADYPFLDTQFTGTLYENHLKYAAEYSFADGYPIGLAPEILARGILPILAGLAKDNAEPVSRNTVFETIKKDINSFDIETDIAPVDLRQLRLTFACDTKRNSLLCASLEGIDATNYGKLVAERAPALRTLPSFYGVQVAGKCPFECAYCPYPAFCRSGKGISPDVPATERTDTMPLESFSRLASKIASFSDDAVISLSLWGECAYHPEIASLVAAVLEHPGLSVLIETTGIGWRPEDIRAIAAAVDAAPARTNGQKPVIWIISLDAAGTGCYAAAHGLVPSADAAIPGSAGEGERAVGEGSGQQSLARADGFLREALGLTERLTGLFPGAVWPQMVRMKGNEIELETFYRFWKQKYGQVIIQKHDHFCRTIQDLRVADLSPLVRNPCWHLKRDMTILIDGTVSLCREDVYATRACGNAFKDELQDIWKENGPGYEQHVNCVYEGLCGACDEYYTYNF
jgi:spiro-SPASM protein